MKLTADGNIIWEKSFGGYRYDRGLILLRREDGTFFLYCHGVF
jgi:hypothetical protein